MSENARGLQKTILFKYGSGITCDGVKIDLTSKKYYDFVLHFLGIRRRSMAKGGGYDWEIKKNCCS